MFKVCVSWVSNWKVELTARGLGDAHSQTNFLSVSIDYCADANAAAKRGLAGAARFWFRAVGERKGRSTNVTDDWWPVDRLRAALRFMTGPRLRRMATGAAHSLINLLSAPLEWMGHSCGGSRWGHCRKHSDAFCHWAAVCVRWWATVSHYREILSAVSEHTEQQLLCH